MVFRPKPGSRVFGLLEIEKGYVDLLYALAACSAFEPTPLLTGAGRVR